MFEKMFFHKDPFVKYSGLLAMEIFSTSEKLETIDFLFRKPEVLVDFQNFLTLQIVQNSENLKITQEILNVLNEVFDNKMKKNSIEFGFMTEYLEENENKKKTDEIFKHLKVTLLLLFGTKAFCSRNNTDLSLAWEFQLMHLFSTETFTNKIRCFLVVE